MDTNARDFGAPIEGDAAPSGASLRRRTLIAVAFVALTAFTCFYGLWNGPPLGDHESINALAARSSLDNGQWLIPVLHDAPRIRKPPLGIWLIGATSKLMSLGADPPTVTALSARLPSAIAAFANALVIVWLGSMLLGVRGGWIAGFIWAGCAATVFYARNAQVDMVLTLFTTLAFAFFWRGAMHKRRSQWAMVGFYVAFAFAMLAKAPLPLATVGLPLFVYWFVTVPVLSSVQHGRPHSDLLIRRGWWAYKAQLARLGWLWLVPGLILWVMAVGAWPAYVLAHVDNAAALWRIEYVARFTGDLSARTRPVWYYIPLVFGLTVPFMASIPEAVTSPFLSRYSDRKRALAYAFTWAMVGTLFLSSAAFKRPHYLLSLMPAYCLLLAPVIERSFFGVVALTRRTARAVTFVLPTILAVGFVVGGFAVRRRYPALIGPYAVACSGAFVVWCASCITYARSRRTTSFVLLNLGVPILLLVMWPASAERIDFNAEADALAEQLRAHNIGPENELLWADKRPNAAIEFYSQYKIRRLMDPNEMAGLRHGRGSVSARVYDEMAKRIAEQLANNDPVYVVMRDKYYRMIVDEASFSTKVLFRLDGFREDAEDALVVFTQNREHNTDG